MPICRLCHTPFKNRLVIDGKYRDLTNRRFCLTCSPFGGRNTRSLDVSIEPKKWTEPPSTVYTRNYRRRLKQKMVNFLGGKCIKCGYSKCLKALDFHHRDINSKLFSLAGAYSKSWKRIEAELEKCDLLCRNCHAELHDEEESLLKKNQDVVPLAE